MWERMATTQYSAITVAVKGFPSEGWGLSGELGRREARSGRDHPC